MARPEDLATLSRLLGLLFEAEELRRFTAGTPGVGDLELEIPDRAASPAEVTFALVKGLDRRGLLDADFFARLRAERPRRADEIDRIASRVMSPGPARLSLRAAGRSVVVALVVLTLLALLYGLRDMSSPRPDIPPVAHQPPDPPGPKTSEPIAPAGPTPAPRPAEPRAGSTVKIASDNKIEAPGGNVTVIGIQEGR